jgi:hypothetical protein
LLTQRNQLDQAFDINSGQLRHHPNLHSWSAAMKSEGFRGDTETAISDYPDLISDTTGDQWPGLGQCACSHSSSCCSKPECSAACDQRLMQIVLFTCFSINSLAAEVISGVQRCIADGHQPTGCSWLPACTGTVVLPVAQHVQSRAIHWASFVLAYQLLLLLLLLRVQ